MKELDTLQGNFKKPPKGYGEVPFFWWLGDKLTKEKLSWILDQIKHSHISGIQVNYAHSDNGGRSYGLTLKSEPPVFSDEWWEIFSWFMQECKKYDISLSLSDYTLGSPGQESYMDEVIKKHPDFIGKKLVYEDGEVKIIEVPFSVDPMNKNLGKAVIEEFFGKFEERFPNEGGKGLNFFFSDELNFNIRGNVWNDEFEDEFIKRKGYNIVPYLKAIFEDIGDITPKIRLDYYDVIVQLSEEGYFKPVYNWHEERNMTFGCDHGGRGTDVTEFGDYFRTQRWNQGPGNDQPNLGSHVVKNKVSSSIAHLYKRPRTWLEGFYGSGWGTSSGDVLDAVYRNFAMGHNLLSLHGMYYSTHGGMWEWAPPCNHFHMPYWEEMDVLLECTERLSYLLSQGVHRCDVAIIYPVADVEVRDNGNKGVKIAFEVAEKLYNNGIDFDFIDFESIERAVCEDKKICVSDEEYKILVIPNMKTIRFNTISKIQEFAKKGVIIVNIGDMPTQSDRIGREDIKLEAIVEDIKKVAGQINTTDEIVEFVSKSIVRDFNCTTLKPFVQHRKIDNKDIYFVYNVPKGEKCFFRAFGTPSLWNVWTGESEIIAAFETDENGTYIKMPLTEKEANLIVFEQGKSIEAISESEREQKVIRVCGEWEFELKPTLNNKYGDYRLPASDNYIGAEATVLKYKYTNEDCSNKEYDDISWDKCTCSFGTYMWKCDKEISEDIVKNMTAPNEYFEKYDFSMKVGQQNDAGPQQSYHGLKGKITDNFMAMGNPVARGSHSAYRYEGEGTYYFWTTVYCEDNISANISIGEKKPEKTWINGAEHKGETVNLKKGTNYVALKYVNGGTTHFIIQQKNDFVQDYPLSMKWYNNPFVIGFDAMPELADEYCWFRFVSAPGMESMSMNVVGDVVAYSDGEEMAFSEGLYIPKTFNPKPSQIAVKIKQKHGVYAGSCFVEPVKFNCTKGIIQIGDWSKIDGLYSYSGGAWYRKEIFVEDANVDTILKMDDVVSTARVYVNGKLAAIKVAPPFTVDISKFVHNGNNNVEILVYNTLSNLMTTVPTRYRGDVESGILIKE